MLAFTFPGQGSQRPGMGQPWVTHDSWELVDEATAVTGRPIDKLLLETDADELRDTRNAQVTTFVSSLVVLDAVERLGLQADICAGHSLGEYTALTATGALGFADGLELVAARADAMHAAGTARPGVMAAVLGLEDELVEVSCRVVDDDVWIANFNAPGQVVIAGSEQGVAAASAHAKSLGAKRIMPLPVSGAFHTPLMRAARDELRSAIAKADMRDPEVPVIANVDALPHATGNEWGALLSAQLGNPVRWRQTMGEMFKLGVKDVVEVGPGGVLTGMTKRCLPDARSISVSAPEDLDKLLQWISSDGATTDLHLDGEHLFASERVVVSPCAGVFEPAADMGEGTLIEVGAVLGHVAGTEVRSPFAGTIQSYIAVATERVTARQPIAWLRTS
jgi:[acyl-carrier-protein] S-malonyltransferase